MSPQRNILHIKTLPCSLPCPGHPSTGKRAMTSLADLHKGKTNRAKGSKSNKSRKLPSRFLDLKRDLIRGNESAILDSWSRLLQKITPERLSSRDWRMIPKVHFSDIQANNGALPEDAKCALKERVLPGEQPQVLDMYWSKPQLKAREHPNMLTTQAALNKVWSSAPEDVVDTGVPITYCDRFHIRALNNKPFNLGSHLDNGPLERWEDPEYRKCYSEILKGEWENHDPFSITHRLKAIFNMYQDPRGCSAFRTYQGWLSLSDCSPGEGTLHVMPDLLSSTAYTILRSFVKEDSSGNWTLDQETSIFQGAAMGARQEIRAADHPHIYSTGFASIPRILPGDVVFWHCDVAHVVEEKHRGTGDSTMLYIPAAPLCEVNIRYLTKQRGLFSPCNDRPPDFPGGSCESSGTTEEDLSPEGLRAMGCSKFEIKAEALPGTQEAARIANSVWGPYEQGLLVCLRCQI